MKLSRRRLLSLTGENIYNRILSIFNGKGGNLLIKRAFGNLERYDILANLSGDNYIRWPLMASDGNVNVNSEFLRLYKIHDCRIYKAYSDLSTGVSKSSGWTVAGNTNSYPVTGRLAFSGTSGNYIEFTTDNNVTSVGCVLRTGIAGGGVGLVSIDGDNTLADLLPTAQTLVDSGVLANTVLVANGGSLNPTDRVIEEHTNSLSEFRGGDLFTTSLAAGVHTVRITVTGYKKAASSDALIYFHAFTAWGTTLYTLSEALFMAYPIYAIYDPVPTTDNDYPVYEISWNIIPQGASVTNWVGHTNSLKISISPTFTVDGVSKTFTNRGDQYLGQTIAITIQYNIRHPQTSTTNLGTLDMTLTFNNIQGMTIEHTTTWASSGHLQRGYPSMMTTSQLFDRAKSPGTSIATLYANPGYKIDNTRHAMWAWDYDGNLGVLMYVPDLAMTTNNFAACNDGYHFYIDDIGGDATWSKMRLLRFSNDDDNYTSGDIWRAKTNYRFAWFSNGANNILSGL
jgi:hypothetical protein